MLATGQATLKQMLESKAYSQPARARLSFVSPHLDGREDHLPKPLGMQLLDGHGLWKKFHTSSQRIRRLSNCLLWLDLLY